MVTGGPADKPAFLDPARAESMPYVSGEPPEIHEIPNFDTELDTETPDQPSRGIVTRYREIARLHAFGRTNNEICAILGYTASRLSLVLKDPFVQAEIAQWRQRLVDDDAINIMKDAAKDGARRIHKIILDPSTEDRTAIDAAKFAIEKSHGKARQEINVESGTLATFMDMLREMKSRGEVLDVTPELVALPPGEHHTPTVEESADWQDWIKTNL